MAWLLYSRKVTKLDMAPNANCSITPKIIKRLQQHLSMTVKKMDTDVPVLLLEEISQLSPFESVSSGVVSMYYVCLFVFLTELNELKLWGADISSD